ncbi:potassium channel family protein [Streptomyces anandii]|uniref:potassium channel family protein n=1 Tax=Streptomyces anandii TaxID=285454 RepID=UPI001675EF5C|nr:TrkA family potassium uptake protein [Streptomyces anandii]GGX79687.1 Trk system potassium uptake protein TrkA [Streptomyces anandii JCM 4720]
MKVVIVGCGRVGAALAAQLARESHDVHVIDREQAARRRLPPRFPGRFQAGNGFSRSILEQAGIARSDAVVAVTSSDNSNLVIARIAKETFRVPTVLAHVHDPRRANLYQGLGIPTVCDVTWSVHRIHQMLLHRHLVPDVTFGNGETLLVRSALPAYLAGRKLSEFEVDGEIRVVEVTRDGRSLMPRQNTTAAPGDVVTFVVAAHCLHRLRAFLDKELGT